MGAQVGDAVTGVLGGRYRIIRLLGEGGMAFVYQAHDAFLGRDVAVKVFRSSAAGRSDLRRQTDEINALAKLSHPSLVTLFDVAVDDSVPGRPHLYYVMELVPGDDLSARLKNGPLLARLTALIGLDIAEGLEYVHARGIVHRDIKPANVLLDDHPDDPSRLRAKLTDFGIVLLPDGARVTAENAVTGTVAYISPEQSLSQPIGPASDVYSLGLVLLECFTGHTEFPGSPIQSAVARLVRQPVIPDDVPPEWRTLLAAMTARDPADRPGISDVVMALRQAPDAQRGRHRTVAEPGDHSADDSDAPRDPIAAAANKRASTRSAAEALRLAEVRRYEVLDTPPDGAFDRITAIAARVFSVPIALVTIVDHDRVWFKSRVGVEITEVGRDPGLCASAILDNTPWIVEDARADPRTLANPLVAGEFGMQFYLGVPLTTGGGHNLGTLCVMDYSPREVSAEEIATLEDLAAIVVRELDLRLEARKG